MASIINHKQQQQQQEIEQEFSRGTIYRTTIFDIDFESFSKSTDEMEFRRAFNNVVEMSETYISDYDTIDMISSYYVQAAYCIGLYFYKGKIRLMAQEYFEKIIQYVTDLKHKDQEDTYYSDQQIEIMNEIFYYYVFAAIHIGDMAKETNEEQFLHIPYYEKALFTFQYVNNYPEEYRFPTDQEVIARIEDEVDKYYQNQGLPTIVEDNTNNGSKGGAKRRHKKKKRNTRRNKKSQKRRKRKRNTRRKK
tara:strand:+ start:63 stop:809 length:747 start_codon:yes stop_codon:yes gene_type:complete